MTNKTSHSYFFFNLMYSLCNFGAQKIKGAKGYA